MEISSPKSPSGLYLSRLNCTITVKLKGEPELRFVCLWVKKKNVLMPFSSDDSHSLLRFQFVDFRIESGFGGVNKGDDFCVFDSVKMESVDRSLGTPSSAPRVICGDWSRRLDRLEFISGPGQEMRIRFETDNSVEFRGFKIRVSFLLLISRPLNTFPFQVSPVKASDFIATGSGRIVSLSDSSAPSTIGGFVSSSSEGEKEGANYKDNANVTYEMEAPPGTGIRITFQVILFSPPQLESSLDP